jgi:hypothetical protein
MWLVEDYIYIYKDMCSNEIGLQGQNILTIVDLMFNMICGGGTYMRF